MKKTLLIALALCLGAVASQAQGLVSIAVTGTYFATTNNGTVSGKAFGTGSTGYYYELLTSANTSLPSSANQIQTPSNLALWSDTGVFGTSGTTGLNAGKITSGTAVTANNWVAPSGSAYDDTQSY